MPFGRDSKMVLATRASGIVATAFGILPHANMKPEALVLVPSSMLMSTESAIGGRQAVVHAVPNRLQCLQISEYCLQIAVP